MAVRPIFIPRKEVVGVNEKLLEFNWHPGFSVSQKRKSINELHTSAGKNGIRNILEVSSKSEDDLGVKLSAFNLMIKTKKYENEFTVETAFQGSKKFERGGPYKDLFGLDSRASKKDIRLKESGNLISFNFFGKEFPLIPRTYFYDWLYINALVQNPIFLDSIKKYGAFSDIEFNPKKSINCQAHALALYVSLSMNDCIDKAIESPESFLLYTKNNYSFQDKKIGIQSSFI